MADDLALASPPDEAQEAQGAREAAAARLARPAQRPRQGEAEAPLVQAPFTTPHVEREQSANPFDEFANPFDQFDGENKDLGLKERARLSAVHSYYRGTLAGTGMLNVMAHYVKTPDAEDTPASVKRSRDAMRLEYQDIVADLARWDTVAPWDSAGEAAASLGGGLGASLLTPESLVGATAKGATWLYRTAKAAWQNAAVMGAVDPVVQALGMKAGVQKEYSPLQTVGAMGMGAVIGGGLHLGGELVSGEVLKGMRSRMASEDPQFRGAAEAATMEREAPAAAPGETPPSPRPATEAPPESPAGAASMREAAAMPRGDGEAAAIPQGADYGSLLKETFLDSPSFSRVLKHLQEDRSVTLDALRQIADDFLPYPLSSKSKASKGSVIEAIARHQHLDARQRGKLDRLDDQGDASTGNYAPPPASEVGGSSLRAEELNPATNAGGREMAAPSQAPETGYTKLLRDTFQDSAAFNQTIERLRSDPSVKLDDLRSIADGFMPYRLGSKSKASRESILKAITDHQAVDARQRMKIANLGSGEELAALSVRQSGGELPMERRRPEAGVARETAPGEPDPSTALTTVPEAPSPQRETALRSLQQQSMDLAAALDVPLRQGRIANKDAMGVFKSGQGVIRVREVPDFEVVAHEAGHFIEAKAGPELTALTEKFAAELRPLVSNPAAYDPSKHVQEGFAEYVRRYIGNPAWAEMNAPAFTTAFRDYMGRQHPDMLRAVNSASASYRAYLEAPSVDAIGAVIRSVDEEPHGMIGTALAAVREAGFPSVTRAVLIKARDTLFDDKAPIVRAVRDMARAIKAKTGQTVELKSAENPEVLARLLPRAQQMALGDMMDGVRPYHGVQPEGPSLSAALETATGGRNSGGWGKFDPEKKASFSTYLVARRAEYLWRKFDEGRLPNPPVSFSKGDAVRTIAELERGNDSFRAASDMVHDYTRQLLRKSYDGGLIDADLYNKLGTEEFYVPFMRDMTDKPVSAGGLGASPDGPGMTQVVKRMQGSSRDIKDPIESLMMQTFLVNRTLQHNDLIKSFVVLADRAGIAGGKYVERIPAQEARKHTYNMTDAIERLAKERGIDADEARVFAASLGDLMGEDPIMGSFFRMEPTGKRGEPIVFYKDGGELLAARFMSENEGLPLYELLGTMPGKMTDVFSEMIAATSSIVRAGIVTNPTFVVSNYIRDQFAAAILRSDYIPILSGLKGIKEEITQGESARLYGIAGGVSPGSAIAPIERAVEADINALAKKGYTVNRFTSFKGFLEFASITEAGTRNSIFGKVMAAKRAEGLSDYEAMVEAAFQATDILDFSRHGSHTEAVRRYVPFINAHLQGLDKAYRTMVRPVLDAMKGDQVFVKDSADFKNALMSWVKVWGVGGVLGAGWAALNRESEAYREASPRIKGTHVVIPWGNKIVLVPKPFELGLGFTLGEYAFQRIAQDDERAAGQFAEAAWDVIAPPNPLEDIPVIRLPIELKTGVSLFTGRQIVPDTIARRAPEEQYTERTSKLAKMIGKQFGISPIKVDYAVGSAFGTWGRDMMAMSAGIDQDSPAANWDDSVFLRRFIKDPTRSSNVTAKFWDFMGQTTGKFNQAVAAYDNLVKSFDEEGAKRFVSKLETNERAFVVLKSAANEDGKPAFNADQKRLHPLTRAYDAVTILNGIRRDLSQNTFRTFESGDRQRLDPRTQRDLIDNVRELAQLEMRNALVIMKDKGYAGRPILDTAATMEKIKALSPDVSTEIATRYATAKVYTTKAVVAAYPQLKDALLREGSEADLDSLSFEAQADGYEFGGDRVKRPAKRRLYIAPTQPAPALPEAVQ